VCFKERATDLADGAVNVCRRELALRPEVLEGVGKPRGEGAESSHSAISLPRRDSHGALPRAGLLVFVEAAPRALAEVALVDVVPLDDLGEFALDRVVAVGIEVVR